MYFYKKNWFTDEKNLIYSIDLFEKYYLNNNPI